MSEMQTLVRNVNNRLYPPRPIVGVGGLIFDGERVLLGLRGKEPGKGKWSIPGGAVRVGETLEEALKREIREEVGIDVEIERIVAVLDRIIKDDIGNVAYHYVLVDFLCLPRFSSPPVPGSDLIDCRYIHVDDLDRYPLTRGTAYVIRQSLNQLKGMYPPVTIYDSGKPS